jgi:hypothetical protein
MPKKSAAEKHQGNFFGERSEQIVADVCQPENPLDLKVKNGTARASKVCTEINFRAKLLFYKIPLLPVALDVSSSA